jgi:predicted GH43/DUF377 family glycosyl hydrolase
LTFLKEITVRIQEFLQLQWKEYPQNPIIKTRFPSWFIADPTCLTPDATPDQKWHLFAHSTQGVHQFTSKDGIRWDRLDRLVAPRSLRPYIFQRGNQYYIFYERLTKLRYPVYASRIEARVSSDLAEWSEPWTILEPEFPWHRHDKAWAGNIGNPCLIADNSGYRLYYSAGFVYLKDCHFFEPRYIGVAQGTDLRAPFTPMQEPVLGPDTADSFANLGSGAIKVLRLEDGFIGLQNSIYWDTASNHSASAIRILRSEDGLKWEITGEPILKPGKGWKKSHVYALDLKLYNGQYWMYYNARSGWLFGLENIGLVWGSSTGATQYDGTS